MTDGGISNRSSIGAPRALRAAACATAVLLAALAAGCASSNTTTSATSSYAQTGGADAGNLVPGLPCPSGSKDPAIVKLSAGLKQTALPTNFHAVAAVRCTGQMRGVPGDGEWIFSDAQRADTGLGDLLAALRLPSSTSPAGGMYACPAMGMAEMPFALVDAKGNVVSPLLPHGVCGFPLPQVNKAMGTLRWHTETEQRVRQSRTQLEIDTGCSGEFKDMFDHRVQGTPEPWDKVRRPGNPQPVTACFYTVEPQPADNYIALGSLKHGVKLTAGQQTAVADGLDQAGNARAPECATEATRFAALDGPYSGMLVELDGCRRILWPNGFLSAAPAALSQLLASLAAS